MNCKEIITSLAYKHVCLTCEMREHLRHCADCRLLARIIGLPKVVELPVGAAARRSSRNAS